MARKKETPEEVVSPEFVENLEDVAMGEEPSVAGISDTVIGRDLPALSEGIMGESPQPQTVSPVLSLRAPLERTIRESGHEDNQIMSFVTPRISEERWSEIETYITNVLTQAIADRAELDARLKIYNDLYEGVVPANKEIPWPGCANINVPITQEMLDALHARLSKAALGVYPIVLVKGEDAAGVEVERKLENYYATLSNSINLDEVASQATFLALRDGVGIIKVFWDRRTRRVKTRKMKPLLDETGAPIIDPRNGSLLREESVEIDEVVEYDNVRCTVVELKDFYVLPAHAYDISRHYAKGVAERVWMRRDEIMQRAKGGDFDKEAVKRLFSGSSTKRATIEPEHADHMGVSATVDTPGFEEYEMFDVYMNYDLDNDGYEEECVFTVCPDFNVLVRAEVFPYWHQLRPYVPIIPWPRPRRFYGFSVPQRLEPIQRELNAIHNQRLDAVTLRLSPPMLITRSAVMRGDAAQAWGPLARIEVNSREDVDVLTLPDINPSSFSEETILRQYAERVVGLYDLNTPRGTGSRRTRAEIGAIQQEGMVRFDYMMKMIQRSIVKVFEQIHQLKIQYMPEREVFEAVGIDGVQKFELTREEMLANIRFIANGDLPVSDKERNRQDAYFLYQALMGNPLVQGDLRRVHHVTKELIEAWEKKAPEKFIGTEQEAVQQMQMMQQMAAQTAPRGGMTNEQRGTRPNRSSGA